MIIKDIYVDGFGVFKDFSLSDLKKGINVIRGDNESGKSTLLKFLRFTLFGYPRSVDERMSPLNGGNHGGRICAQLSDETEVVFARDGGKAGGDFYAQVNGNTTRDAKEWSRLLGGASGDLFENIYAISIDELQDIDSLTKSGVEDKIFSLGLGIGNSSIKRVQDDIQKNADAIWTQRGSTKEIHEIVGRLRNQKESLRQIQDDLPKYLDLKKSIAAFDDDILRHDSKVLELANEERDLENYLKCYDNCKSISDINTSLSELPPPQKYDPSVVDTLRNLELEKKRLEKEIDVLVTGTDLEPGISELENQLEHFQINTELLNQVQSVEFLERNLEKYKQDLSESAESLEKTLGLKNSIDSKLSRIGVNWNREMVTNFADLVQAGIQINTFARKLNELDMTRVRIEGELSATRSKTNVSIQNVLAVLVVLVFTVASMFLFYISLPVWGAILLIVGFLAAIGLKFLIRDGASETHSGDLTDVLEKQGALQRNYRAYVEEQLSLDESPEPDLVIEKLNLIDQTKRDISEFQALESKQANDRQPFIAEFEKCARALIEISRLANSDGPTETYATQILEEFSSSQKNASEQKALQLQLAKSKAKLERTETNLESKQSEIDDLVSTTGAEDLEDFFSRNEINDEVLELIRLKDQAEAAVAQVVGEGRVGEITGYFEHRSKTEVETELETVRNKKTMRENEWGAKHTEKGEALNQIKLIEGETTHAQLMTEIETEKEKLVGAYQEWIANKIAAEILQCVKRRYETEKQPEVLKRSSSHFREITAAKYESVNANLDNREIEIIDGKAMPKKITQLSRGTKEQLLISLRLGFIEEYELEAEPLPLIVDDILVHFDRKRARAAARVFHQFAQDRQVLIFTCHDSTLEYFEDLQISVFELRRES